MNYNRAIKTLAAARGLSLKQLADKLGMDKASLTRLGRLGNSPTSRTLESVARALEVPLYLLVLLASDPEELGPEPAAAQLLGAQILARLLAVPVQS